MKRASRPDLAAALIALALIALMRPAGAAAAVRAWLDRDQVALGETVTLNVEVEGAAAGPPDFSVLDADFERRGSSSTSQIAIVNGSKRATTLFAISLQPRRQGRLRIPPLEVGGERTPELQLTVAPSPVDTRKDGDVFLETEVTPGPIYVQQELLYVLRLLYAVNLVDGQIQPPAADGVEVRQLGEDLRYQSERNGRRYSVIERRFALVPQRSGRIRLSAPEFTGTGLLRDRYGGLFGPQGVQLSAAGEPLEVEVRPRPATAADPWLPARELLLETTGEVLPQQVRVGEPVTLGVLLRARGLAPSQLPEIALPTPEGAAVYPDRGSVEDLSDRDGLAAERLQRFVIVPQKAGTLELPALHMPWWDVAGDRQRWAEIPARRIEVLPAAQAAAQAKDGASPPSPAAAPPGPVPLAASPAVADRPEGLVLAALAGLLAGLLGGYLFGRRQGGVAARAKAAHDDEARPRPDKGLREAMDRGDPAAILAALRALAPVPGALERQLAEDGQRRLVRELERRLYAPAAGAEPADPALLAALRQAFRHGPRWLGSAAGPRSGAGEPFPPLYPERAAARR